MPKLRHALIALALAGVASTLAVPGTAQQSRPRGACDIYAGAGTPCVTAHSTVRSLSARYNGPLYQLKHADGRLLDIGVIAGGFADAAAHDAFCAGALCYINRIYDQSGKGNDLMQAPPGPLYPGPDKGAFDTQPIADMAPITIGGGHKAYGVYIMPGMGLRNNNARDLPIDDEPAGIHAVVDGEHYSNGCCFNYGNASTNGLAVGTGTMESVYFGTSTGWGSGSGTGPWIMSDMEAGLFSGYNARVNDANPTIAWRFVTGVFGGGGRNFWELKGGNAQRGGLQTFYAGVRPGSKENSAYYPMHKKGAIQMGNGGDNGNGSAGTFYEGVMTAGHPGGGVADEVQANIVAAKYDVARLAQSRLTSFTPATVKDVTASFANTTAASVNDVRLTVSLPAGWTARASGPATFATVAPGATVRATFQITAPARAGMGFLTLRATWAGGTDVSQQRVRSVEPVTLNEVRFASGGNATDQFIELYNAGASPVDISGWSLINTRTWSAPVRLAIVPAGTKIAPRSHYLLGLANSGLAAPAAVGAATINLRSTAGLSPGAEILVDGETHTVKSGGTAATAPTRVFINVSTGPWLEFPVGTTNLPVHSADGFVVGEKISIDLGGNTEIATVTSVGTAATQTTLAASTTPGATNIKVAALADVSAGDTLTISTGQRMEPAVVASVGTAGPDGTGVTLKAPLERPHTAGVDVWARGTGISFTPATRFAHRSGDAVQALGSGVVLERPLDRAHAYGGPVRYSGQPNEGYQGPAPHAWFGSTLFITGGAIALTDASGAVVTDAIVYGSQQSNSSANGYITRPDLATLEGVQHRGGCMAVVPGAGSGPATANIAATAAAPGAPNRSIGRFPDGRDTDSLCADFMVQPATTVPEGAAAGSTNIKVAGVAEFAPGQRVTIGSGPASESAVIASVGTAGSTRAGAATQVGDTVIPVVSTAGFVVGQSITIDSGANQETATIALVQGGRGGARLTITAPLTIAHPSGAPLAGSGITLTTPLARAHPSGAVVTTDLPTPGTANKYSNPRAVPPTRQGLRLVQATELPDGTLPRTQQDGNFVVGPTHAPAPETMPREDVPKGTVHQFTVTSAESAVYPDGIARDRGTFGTPDPANPAKLDVSTSRPAPWTRNVSVFVPAQYVPGTIVPFIVGADGPDSLLFTTLENLIAQRRLPVMIGIAVGNGGGDAQGSQRGREYDTLSARYAEFIETDVLPQVERRFNVRLSNDPDQRATMGCSSGAAAAFGMAWYRTDLYHRVLSYSGTFVNQQWPWNPETPQGAWGYHTTLVPNTPRKPLRIWMHVGDRDLYNPNVMRDGMHDWVGANERMARALAAKAYRYQFVFVRNAGHCDRVVKAQTLPAALEYVWAK